MLPTFKRYDYADREGTTQTLAAEIIRVADELVCNARECERKNSMVTEQRPNSERSFLDKLEKLLAVERIEHPNPTWDMIAASAHAEGIDIEVLVKPTRDWAICQARIRAARTAILSAGCPPHEVARVLNCDIDLVKHWIATADVPRDR